MSDLVHRYTFLSLSFCHQMIHHTVTNCQQEICDVAMVVALKGHMRSTNLLWTSYSV